MGSLMCIIKSVIGKTRGKKQDQKLIVLGPPSFAQLSLVYQLQL